jgi:Tol biopolymer transport system component
LRYSTQATGDGVAGACVAFSETGNPACKAHIAFQEGETYPFRADREVWVTDIDGSNPVNVSKAPTADDCCASWSPDGRRVAFLSNRSGVYDIYAVNADGTNLINLTPASTDDSSAAVWSPDGAHIAFVRAGRVWTMNADGTSAAPLSDLPSYPPVAWSPDGKRLVFDVLLPANIPGSIGPIVVYVAAIDTGAAPVKLSPFMTSERDVAWAPASKVVWANMNDVYIAKADGTSLLNVTSDAAHWNTSPRLSPDEQTIVFGSDISGNAEIWSVPASGGTKTRLTHNSSGSAKSDAWGDLPSSISIDGSLVAFSRMSPMSTDHFNSDIGVVDIHGTKTYTFNVPGGVNAVSPTFSPCPIRSSSLLAAVPQTNEFVRGSE